MYNYADLAANPHALLVLPVNEQAGQWAKNWAFDNEHGRIEVHPSTWGPRGRVQVSTNNPRAGGPNAFQNLPDRFPGEGWCGNKVDANGLGHPILFLYSYRVPQAGVLLTGAAGSVTTDAQQFFGWELGEIIPTHYHFQHNNHDRLGSGNKPAEKLYFTSGFETITHYYDTGIVQQVDHDYTVGCYLYHGDEAAMDSTEQPYFCDYRVREFFRGQQTNEWSVDAAELPTAQNAGFKAAGGFVPNWPQTAPWNGLCGTITYGAQAFILPIGSTRPPDFDDACAFMFPRWVNGDKVIWAPWVNLGIETMSQGTFNAGSQASDTLVTPDSSATETTKVDVSLHNNSTFVGTVQLRRRRPGDTAWRVVASYTDVAEEIKEFAGRWEVQLFVSAYTSGAIDFDLSF